MLMLFLRGSASQSTPVSRHDIPSVRVNDKTIESLPPPWIEPD